MKTNKKFKRASIAFIVFAVITSVIALAGAFIIVSPVDALPDFLPYFIGYIDDILVSIGTMLTRLLSVVSTALAIYYAIKSKKMPTASVAR